MRGILGVARDHRGSPKFRSYPCSDRAVGSDPAKFSSNLAFSDCLLLPSIRFDDVGTWLLLSRGSFPSLALRPGSRSVYT